MKKIIIPIVCLISYSSLVKSEEVKESPITTSSFTFCHLDTKCTTNIRLANTTPYQVKISSLAFNEQGIDLNSMYVFEESRYYDLKENNLDTGISEQPLQGRRRAYKQLSSLEFEPLEVKFIELKGIEERFALEPGKRYMVGTLTPFVNLYINGKFADIITIRTNYSLLTIPTEDMEIKERPIKQFATPHG
ncbi:hypothetical protein OIZ54_13880 [Pseudoalteromonas sp. A3]|uniref:hypothetical protein n=1 Tax=Pseudoalteromonas TaxID=53246 RepID=UPI000BBBF280|nr:MULTISPECIES: hypothetical protein [Pseudoalteromonas]MCW1719829.1 hypothetical protein [Pseudoalteromonas sp. A3]